jgi:hypothetical protein
MAEVVNSSSEMERMINNGQVSLVCVDDDALSQILPLIKKHRNVQVFLWFSESIEALLDRLVAIPQINHLFGLRYPDAPPRTWELLAIIRRWADRKQPPQNGFLDWGAAGFERTPGSTQDLQKVVDEVETFAKIVVGDRLASSMSEVAHELLMNAMYDAPVDHKGRQMFAHDRTSSIRLEPQQRPRFFCGCDGSRLLLSAEDPFGRLKREHVFGGLARSLANGTMDKSGGGAGLGFMVIYRACTMLFFDVIQGVRTRATAILELDIPVRELRNVPKSIHFFQEKPA